MARRCGGCRFGGIAHVRDAVEANLHPKVRIAHTCPPVISELQVTQNGPPDSVDPYPPSDKDAPGKANVQLFVAADKGAAPEQSKSQRSSPSFFVIF